MFQAHLEKVMYYTCVVSSLRGDHCHQQRASYLRQRLQTLRPPTQALQWLHFSTLLSTLIQAMKKKAANVHCPWACDLQTPYHI